VNIGATLRTASASIAAATWTLGRAEGSVISIGVSNYAASSSGDRPATLTSTTQ
jgi:hypothetical protein